MNHSKISGKEKMNLVLIMTIRARMRVSAQEYHNEIRINVLGGVEESTTVNSSKTRIAQTPFDIHLVLLIPFLCILIRKFSQKSK